MSNNRAYEVANYLRGIIVQETSVEPDVILEHVQVEHVNGGISLKAKVSNK